MAYRSYRGDTGKKWGRIAGMAAGFFLITVAVVGWFLIQDAIVFTADGMRFEPGSLFTTKEERAADGAVEIALPRATTSAAVTEAAVEFAPTVSPSLNVEEGERPEGALQTAAGRLLTSSMISTENFARTAKLLAETGETMVLIDLKDASGELAYQSGSSLASRAGANASSTADFYLRDAVTTLQENGIRVFARISCVEDSCLAALDETLCLYNESGTALHDAQGYALIDPGQKSVRDYLVSIATEIAAMGFDGLVLDNVYLPQSADASQDSLAELVRGIKNVMGSAELGVVLCRADGLIQPEAISEYMDAAWGDLSAPGVQYSIDEAGRLYQK